MKNLAKHLVIILLSVSSSVYAQRKISPKYTLRDSLDQAFDLSDFVIAANGFVPVPLIITEPALGGFGGGLALVFLKKRAPSIDTIKSKVIVTPTAPDITGVVGLYTLNDSWGMMGFRSGTWAKARSKYKAGGGLFNLNLSFYRTIQGKEREFEFNLRTIPAFASLQRKLKGTRWSAGMQFLYLNTQVKLRSDENLPDFVSDTELDSRVSMPGVLVEFDNRDNVFTPDRGLRFHASLGWADNVFGSDYDYMNFNSFVYAYIPIRENLIAGLRYEVQQVFDDPPFYLVPYINLRGVPTARYQGNIFSVAEAELRWDFVTRWSIVAFGGTGKAYDEWDEFGETEWVSSGGAGFRYLMARKFKLRMGLDFARGPEQWAYYIVLGSAWFK